MANFPNSVAASGFAMVAAVVSRGSPYLALLIAARLLPAESFGAYALAGVAANLVAALISGGGSLWTNRFAAKAGTAAWRDTARQQYLRMSLGLALGTFTVGVATFAAVPDVWRPLVATTTAAAIVTGLAEAAFSTLRSAGQITWFFLGRDLTIPLLGLALLLAVQPQTAPAALGLQALAAGLAGLGAMIRIHSLGLLAAAVPSPWRGARLIMLWRYTAGLITNNVAGRAIAYVDVLVLGTVIAAAAVGPYRAAAQLALGFVVMQNAVYLGLPWHLRDQGDRAERAARTQAVRKRQWVLVAASLPALLTILAFAPEILSLFGPGFRDFAGPLRLLCLIRFLDLLWGPQPQLLVSNGLADRDTKATLLGLLVWLGGFAVLLGLVPPLFAAVGAHALASPCAHLMRWYAIRRSGLKPPIELPHWLNLLALCYAGALTMSYLSGG